MNGHGGPGRGQGRKPVPVSWGEMIEIGSRCEYLLHRQREEIAIERIEQSIPDPVKELQSEIRSKRKQRMRSIEGAASELSRAVLLKEFERYHAHAMKRVKSEIAPVLDKKGRIQALRKFMPKKLTREQVQQQVAEEWQAKGRADITSRRVKDIWTEYGHIVRAVRASDKS